MIGVNKFKNSLNLIISKSTVQPFQNFLELLDCQLSTLVSIIGVKGLIKGQFFRREDFVQFDEAFFDLYL